MPLCNIIRQRAIIIFLFLLPASIKVLRAASIKLVVNASSELKIQLENLKSIVLGKLNYSFDYNRQIN